MKDRDIVANARRFPDNQSRGVIEENSLTDARRRIDIGLENVGGPALQVQSKIASSMIPQPMGKTMGLDLDPLADDTDDGLTAGERVIAKVPATGGPATTVTLTMEKDEPGELAVTLAGAVIVSGFVASSLRNFTAGPDASPLESASARSVIAFAWCGPICIFSLCSWSSAQ